MEKLDARKRYTQMDSIYFFTDIISILNFNLYLL